MYRMYLPTYTELFGLMLMINGYVGIFFIKLTFSFTENIFATQLQCCNVQVTTEIYKT